MLEKSDLTLLSACSTLETCFWASSVKIRVMGCYKWGCLFPFRAVVEKRLAACVNLVPQITSM